MQIASITSAEHADFLSLVNAEIRPDRAKTNAWDDFPLILAPENSTWQLIARAPDGSLAAGLACLVRDVQTSCGLMTVAGIGSVVTDRKFRGQGLSTALQNEMLVRLRRKNVPLAVLWTDQPEIYAGRGFVAAGWEVHVDLGGADLPLLGPDQGEIRDFRVGDVGAAERLYHAHELHTRREPGDSAALYGMPGTRGLVLADDHGEVQAAIFCGKGADFPDYVAEWSGPAELVLRLLAAAAERGWAHHVLAPAGSEDLVDRLVHLGASWFAVPSGYWVVLDERPLLAAAAERDITEPAPGDDPVAWLGRVDPEGQPHRGLLDLAVWGLDSV